MLSNPFKHKVLNLSGGVGGSKLALGLSKVLSSSQLSVVVNTADDFEHFGLHISPDLDTLMVCCGSCSTFLSLSLWLGVQRGSQLREEQPHAAARVAAARADEQLAQRRRQRAGASRGGSLPRDRSSRHRTEKRPRASPCLVTMRTRWIRL